MALVRACTTPLTILSNGLYTVSTYQNLRGVDMRGEHTPDEIQPREPLGQVISAGRGLRGSGRGLRGSGLYLRVNQPVTSTLVDNLYEGDLK